MTFSLARWGGVGVPQSPLFQCPARCYATCPPVVYAIAIRTNGQCGQNLVGSGVL